MEEYSDLRKIDKVHEAMHGVKELEIELGDGIKKLINNKESLDDLDERAAKMKGKESITKISQGSLRRTHRICRGCCTGGT